MCKTDRHNSIWSISFYGVEAWLYQILMIYPGNVFHPPTPPNFMRQYCRECRILDQGVKKTVFLFQLFCYSATSLCRHLASEFILSSAKQESSFTWSLGSLPSLWLWISGFWKGHILRGIASYAYTLRAEKSYSLLRVSGYLHYQSMLD